MLETNQIKFTQIKFLDFLLIFLALFCATLLDQYLNSKIEEAIRSPDGLSDSIWAWGTISVFSSLILPLIVSMLCCLCLVRGLGSRQEFFKQKFELGLIETMRVWGYTFLWSFLFILPGIYKYSVYLLSPLIVMFSKKYAAGEVDALQHSTTVSKKFFGKLNFILLIFLFVFPVLISSMVDEYKVFRIHPFTAMATVFLETVIVVVFHFFIIKHFLKNLNEVENGTYV